MSVFNCSRLPLAICLCLYTYAENHNFHNSNLFNQDCMKVERILTRRLINTHYFPQYLLVIQVMILNNLLSSFRYVVNWYKKKNVIWLKREGESSSDLPSWVFSYTKDLNIYYICIIDSFPRISKWKILRQNWADKTGF